MLKTSSSQSGLAGFEKKLTGSDPDDSAVPAPVRKSVRYMLAGAAVTALLGLFWLIAEFADENALIAAANKNANGKNLVNSTQFTSTIIIAFVFEFLFPAVIWLLMARFNRSGQNWARIVSSALCAIDTYWIFRLVNSLQSGSTVTVIDIVNIVLTLVAWAVGVIAIALLWRAESTAYFKARSAQR